MDILEVSVRADAEGAEALAAAFGEHAYGGAVIEETVAPDPGETVDPARPFTVRAFLLLDESLEEKRLALEQAVWALGLLRPLGDIQEQVLKEEDWANTWKKFYTILHIGRRIVIKPSWLEYDPKPNEMVVELDPGMAFGTGLHPTTRLCLAALEKYLHPGDRVLDVGTGSGILSIAAVRLGAGIVDARDIDPIAVETAIKNGAINHVDGAVHVSMGTVDRDEPPAGAQVLLANILAEIVAELMPAFAYNLAPGGTLIASGILAHKGGLVEKAFRENGLTPIETTGEDDWLVMVAKK